MAQETQYCNLRYILGTVYSEKTDASEISPERKSVLAHILETYLTNPICLISLRSICSTSLRNILGILKHTNGSGLNHVTDGESLYRLVLRGASRAVGASDGLDVTTTLLVTSTIQSISLPSQRIS
ncbi:hypothetical protein EYC80_007564 [Monilinia laxa]|uniref:Uncharacterized protein n=1 Tax=Monilinia laxa TaxID=61186 RepID=A0A5N6JWB1_MONLA|nr:hypothetical protein EYC80_007564 [Monilinia laxa]